MASSDDDTQSKVILESDKEVMVLAELYPKCTSQACIVFQYDQQYQISSG